MAEDKGKKVLIVDDDDEMQTLYGLYLRGESFEIKEALNGQQALEILAQEPWDLIILDMIMPVMDGEEFLRRLNADPKIKNIPIIIASVNEKIPKDILSLGNIIATLRKPFSIDILVGKIHDVFDKK